ncbi:PP3 [Drosophila ananassae sigmavirus]|uniref:PP3 n=1 Tax=Drosophila ananassae sigmavirus TaxID=1002359 RepID=A0A140D8K7_9RHAB|nr:PP3 [Drosophila ananassae sigmavirus]AMK09231.1 PP3 [Drosophila ananassae sigmavirus]
MLNKKNQTKINPQNLDSHPSPKMQITKLNLIVLFTSTYWTITIAIGPICRCEGDIELDKVGSINMTTTYHVPYGHIVKMEQTLIFETKSDNGSIKRLVQSCEKSNEETGIMSMYSQDEIAKQKTGMLAQMEIPESDEIDDSPDSPLKVSLLSPEHPLSSNSIPKTSEEVFNDPGTLTVHHVGRAIHTPGKSPRAPEDPTKKIPEWSLNLGNGYRQRTKRAIDNGVTSRFKPVSEMMTSEYLSKYDFLLSRRIKEEEKIWVDIADLIEIWVGSIVNPIHVSCNKKGHIRMILKCISIHMKSIFDSVHYPTIMGLLGEILILDVKIRNDFAAWSGIRTLRQDQENSRRRGRG